MKQPVGKTHHGLGQEQPFSRDQERKKRARAIANTKGSGKKEPRFVALKKKEACTKRKRQRLVAKRQRSCGPRSSKNQENPAEKRKKTSTTMTWSLERGPIVCRYKRRKKKERERLETWEMKKTTTPRKKKKDLLREKKKRGEERGNTRR